MIVGEDEQYDNGRNYPRWFVGAVLRKYYICRYKKGIHTFRQTGLAQAMINTTDRLISNQNI